MIRGISSDPAIFEGNGFGKQDRRTIFNQFVKSFNLQLNEYDHQPNRRGQHQQCYREGQ
jgi:hypothetical protein